MTEASDDARLEQLEGAVARLAEDNRRLRNLLGLLGVATLGSLVFLVALTLVPSFSPTLPLIRAHRIELVADGTRTEIVPGRLSHTLGEVRFDSSVDLEGAHLALADGDAYYSNLDARRSGTNGLGVSGGTSRVDALADDVAGARVQLRQTTGKKTRRLRLNSAPAPGLTLTSLAKQDEDGLLEVKLQVDELRARPELKLSKGTATTFSAP